jgi:hypothetical protein
MGVSRQSVHSWVGRYLADSFARFGRSVASAEELLTLAVTLVKVAAEEIRRKHPRWVSEAIPMEWLRKPVADQIVPSTATDQPAFL